jgi:two-component system, OmpR family, aerobic respiration control protein ArcA
VAKKKVNAFDLIQKIEKLAKERVVSQPVVELNEFRSMKNKLEPKIILVIEDDENMQAVMTRIFAEDGYELRLAADGTELTGVLDEVTPDIILMDIGLPWINGFELAELIKNHREMKKIPIIFVSGQASEEDVTRAYQIGADDFIKKPFEIDQLKATVTKYLDPK